jgi:ABC-type multidrug transport system permease subunit
MSNGQAAFTSGGFILIVFGLCYGAWHVDFWHSVLFAIIFGPIAWLIGAAQSVVIDVSKKK